MILVVRLPYRLVFYAALLLVVWILDIFTSFNHQTALAIAIILTFLMLFTYVFRSEGTKKLNIFIILFSFIALPLFILHFLGILNSFSNPLGGILLAITVIFFGILAIFTIIQLNFVEIEYEDKRL